jgi:bifunctional non-homologous end joining protein LigD
MFIPPCLPTPKKRVPSGSEWVHEIKHDGYRLIVRRNGNRVRLYTRRGSNWSHRFPLIVQAVTRLKVRSIIIDGEAVVCGENGLSNFDKLHSQSYDDQVALFAFDLVPLFDAGPLALRVANRALPSSRRNGKFNNCLSTDGGPPK